MSKVWCKKAVFKWWTWKFGMANLKKHTNISMHFTLQQAPQDPRKEMTRSTDPMLISNVVTVANISPRSKFPDEKSVKKSEDNFLRHQINVNGQEILNSCIKVIKKVKGMNNCIIWKLWYYCNWNILSLLI